MTAAKFDVLGIGNAIVDVFAHCDEAFLAENGITKAAMQLIDTDRAEELYGRMGPGTEMSGGSAGNTMAGIASLGGKGAYIGKVRDDQLGQVFTHDIRAGGIEFTTFPITTGPSTARSLILITPDGERTMNTYLGACQELTIADIDATMIAAAGITYLEGYLFDRDEAKAAFYEAARVAHEAGRKVSLTLSDSFCVDRHRAAFRDLVENHVDILFANESEIASLYETGFDQAVAQVRDHCEVSALTRSEKGSLILVGGTATEVAAAKVDRVVDTTGAGDLYAAGFLYGWSRGLGAGESGRIASIAAAEAISHVGARPQAKLAGLI